MTENPPVSAVKLEPEAHNSSAVNHGPNQKIPASSVHECEAEAESALGKEAMKDQKSDIDTEKDDQYRLDKGKVVESNVDYNVIMASNNVLEGKDEGVYSVSHVEGNMTSPKDAINSRDGNGATPQVIVSESEAGASGPTQKIPASSVQVHRPTNEFQISDAETAGVISSLPVDGSESEVLRRNLFILTAWKCLLSMVYAQSLTGWLFLLKRNQFHGAVN